MFSANRLLLAAALLATVHCLALAQPPSGGEPQKHARFVADRINSALLPATPSSAIAWGDVNGDGFADLWVGNHGRPTLFINHDGVLIDGSDDWGIAREGDSHGVAWADIDNDGRLDLVELLGGDRGRGAGQGNRLYRNLGDRFADITNGADIALPELRGRAPLWLDVDRDNELDLLLTAELRQGDDGPILLRQQALAFERFGSQYPFARNLNSNYAQLAWPAPGRPVLVLHNEEYPGASYSLDGSWQRAKLAPLPPPTDHTRDSLWADLNGDGIDDLVLARQALVSVYRQAAADTLHATLHKPRGPAPAAISFRAGATIRVGVYPHAKIWWHREIVYTGDHLLPEADLLPGQKRGGLHFVARSRDATSATSPPSDRALRVVFDATAGTWRVSLHGPRAENANLVISSDEAITDISLDPTDPSGPPEVRLLLSTPAGYVAHPLPPAARACAAAAGGDFDNDGDIDLLLACGSGLDNGADLLLENDRRGNFTLRSDKALGPAGGIADSIAIADYNRDGTLDLVISNGAGQRPFNAGPLLFFRGVPNDKHWLQVDLTPPKGTAFPYGARVIVTANGTTQSRTADGGLHVGGQHEQVLHFGLGGATKVDKLELLLPDGQRTAVTDIAADQRYRVPDRFYNSLQ